MNSRRLSKICFGCEPLGGVDSGDVSVKKISDAISLALELGVNFFDTAAVYGLGLSETRLAKVLGNKRHDVYIATKGGLSWSVESNSSARARVVRNSSPSSLRKSVEDSLRRLKISRIPIYYIHWPDPNVEIRISFELLNKLYDEGKIGQIGCSNFNLDQVILASDVAEISFLQMPINIMGKDISANFKNFLNEKKISLVAYNVLANGLLSGKYNEQSVFLKNDRRSRLTEFQGDNFKKALMRVEELKKIAAAEGMTCAQYSISKIIKEPEVVSVILGIKNCKQLEENWNGL